MWDRCRPAGQVAAGWLEAMHEDVAATGVSFTAVGVVTPDPASVESILAGANRLQERVDYVVVEDATNTLSDFTYWRSSEQVKRFREGFSPTVLGRSKACGFSPAYASSGPAPCALTQFDKAAHDAQAACCRHYALARLFKLGRMTSPLRLHHLRSPFAIKTAC
jgi:hypothetical protein